MSWSMCHTHTHTHTFLYGALICHSIGSNNAEHPGTLVLVVASGNSCLYDITAFSNIRSHNKLFIRNAQIQTVIFIIKYIYIYVYIQMV